MTLPHTSYDRGGDFGAFYDGNQRVKGIEPSWLEWLVWVIVFGCFTLYLVANGFS
jgi:hypothetical protein